MQSDTSARLYYQAKIEELSSQLRERTIAQGRLEAQRNALNQQGILLVAIERIIWIFFFSFYF